jgi:pimeloyl-ACP methyl ester carboxylesterase
MGLCLNTIKSISLIHASKENILLKGIISEAAHVIVEDETITAVTNASQAFKNGKLDKLYKYHGDKTVKIFNAWSGTWSSPWFKSWQMTKLLPLISSPLLVIQGGNDRYGTEKQYNTIISELTGEKELSVIPGCGHSPHITEQQLTIRITARFIENYL